MTQLPHLKQVKLFFLYHGYRMFFNAYVTHASNIVIETTVLLILSKEDSKAILDNEQSQ